MSTVHAASPAAPKVVASPEALSRTRVAVLLGITLFAALFAYYLIGVDEGMSSIFGNTMVLHEFVHDARHLLGFPCH